jgi:hypothetical protein
MYPINQVILGGNPLMDNLDSLDIQIQKMEEYRKQLQRLKNQQVPTQQGLIWDSIDAELAPMSDEQKEKLFSDSEYATIYNRLQMIVQAELLNLVKARIESTQEGKDLLESQLKLTRKLKSQIIEDTNREMQLFNKFKEFSRTNPGITYDEFLRNNI